jgi:hypothetical protein
MDSDLDVPYALDIKTMSVGMKAPALHVTPLD